MVEEEEVCEPHRGAEVVEDVAGTVCQATSVGQVSRAGEVMGEAGEDGYWRSFCWPLSGSFFASLHFGFSLQELAPCLNAHREIEREI